MLDSKIKNYVLIFFAVLINSSCAEDVKKTNEKSPEQTITDTIKNIEVKQSATSEVAVDTAHDAKPDELYNTSSALLVGSWDDVDPADPGPGGQSFILESNGSIYINEQEGVYEGTWSYDPAGGILNLKLSHTTGSGVIDSEVDNDYRIEEMTESRIKINDLSDKYPQLGGFFWKKVNTP
jgi:hypothetical protein